MWHRQVISVFGFCCQDENQCWKMSGNTVLSLCRHFPNISDCFTFRRILSYFFHSTHQHALIYTCWILISAILFHLNRSNEIRPKWSSSSTVPKLITKESTWREDYQLLSVMPYSWKSQRMTKFFVKSSPMQLKNRLWQCPKHCKG